MIWGRYPTAQDILPAIPSKQAAVRGKEAAALEAACAELTTVGVQIKPIVRWKRMGLHKGACLLPEFPADGVIIRTQEGKEIDRSEYVVDRDRAVVFSELKSEIYLVEYQVGYSDGNLPATVQLALQALGKFYLSGSREDRCEADGLIAAWRAVIRGTEAQRDGIVREAS